MIKLRSIRIQLTLWYSAVLLMGLAALGVFLQLAMRHQMFADIDAELWNHDLGLEKYLRTEELDDVVKLRDEIDEISRSVPPGYKMEAVSAKAGTLFVSEGAGGLFRLLPDRGSGEDLWTWTEWKGRRYRVIDHRAVVSGQIFRLLLAESTDQAAQTLQQLGWLLLAAIPGVVLIAGFGGYALSARALAPVDAMTRTARSIGIENLSARLPIPDTDDEVQRLAQTWNEMLSRLEVAVQRISQFTSDASHELRTPIALIRSTAEIALRRSRSEEEYRVSLRQVEWGSERMTQLVEDLLFLARADAAIVVADMRVLHLKEIVDDACAEIAPLLLGKDISLTLNLTNADLTLLGRATALRRMVLALLDNAAKYAPISGNIRVSLAMREQSAILEVRDDGSGIPLEDQSRIFERFYRADPSRSRDSGGHGLGLAIAQTIARQHSGRIEVNSGVEGSTFRIILPGVRLACVLV